MSLAKTKNLARSSPSRRGEFSPLQAVPIHAVLPQLTRLPIRSLAPLRGSDRPAALVLPWLRCQPRCAPSGFTAFPMQLQWECRTGRDAREWRDDQEFPRGGRIFEPGPGLPISNPVQFSRLSEMSATWLRSQQKESGTSFRFLRGWHAGG